MYPGAMPCGVAADQAWHRIPLRVTATVPRYRADSGSLKTPPGQGNGSIDATGAVLLLLLLLVAGVDGTLGFVEVSMPECCAGAMGGVQKVTLSKRTSMHS